MERQLTIVNREPKTVNKVVLLVFSLLLTIYGSPLSYAKGPGTTTGELLKVPVGARSVGMGEAYTAAADDSSAMFWNPAGIAKAEQKEATFMHSALIEDIHYEHLAFIAPGETYSYGAAMSYLGYGDIAGYNDAGTSIGDQSAYSYIFSGAVARHIGNRLAIGATGSLIRQKLADTSAGTFAFNLGALYDLPVNWFRTNYRAGFSIQNLGPGLKFVSERDPLPRKIKFGLAALNVHEWPMNLTLDITKPNDNDTYIGIGSEYWFKQMVALRLGYAGSNDEGQGLRLGVGLKLRGIIFDYAYGSFGDFGATHRIGVSLRFGTHTKQMNDAQRAILQEAKLKLKDGREVEAIMELEALLEQDPENHAVLKRMISAHELVLKKELNEAIAKATEDEAVPSPEDFALQDLIPGQEKVARAHTGGFNPDDPLNLGGLPEAVDALGNDALPSPEAAAIAPAVAAPTPAVTETQAAPEPTGVGAASPDSAVVEQAVPSAEELIGGESAAPATPGAESVSEPAGPVSSSGDSSDGPMLNPADFQ